MIAKIIEWSVKNRFMVILLALVAALAGARAMFNISLDAIPDLSDVQVIVYTEYTGQSPQVVEDQVTYPLSSAMLGVPKAKSARGYSFFGFSLVYVIFEDGVDLYWARSRVLEALNFAAGRLPEGVNPGLGPDATGVGWVYQYILQDNSGKHDLQQLRSLQDWYLRHELAAVPGVAEAAAVGGFVKQYQVEVDPNRLAAYKLSILKVRQAIKNSNQDAGGKLLELGETEFMIRSRGYIKSTEDLESVAVGLAPNGAPILLKDIADIRLGPELRRGLLDWKGQGETVGGIVVARFGENALEVINKVKSKLKELEKGLPPGVKIVEAYDRSDLILRAVDTLKRKLTEEMAVVGLICVVFLLHVRSALVAVFTLPLGILISFLIMSWLGINADIMSLGGVAIAIGVMVDASVVLVENAHKHLERDKGRKPRQEIMLSAAKEVGPALFYSLLIITVSFLPVFTLGEQSGRLFKPLAYTKTFAMAVSSLLAVTVAPVLMTFFIREEVLSSRISSGRRRLIWFAVAAGPLLLTLALGWASESMGRTLPEWSLPLALLLSALAVVCLIRQKIIPEDKNPLSRFFIRVYRPLLQWILKWRKSAVLISVMIVLLSAVPLFRMGGEFMPPLNEGDLLYMPTTLPGISITKAKELLQQTDRIIQRFPEVKHTLGKVGRADTATDPAPLSMIETTIALRPQIEYEKIPTPRFFSAWPAWLKKPLAWVWPEETKGRVVSEWRKKKIDRFFSSWPAWLKKPLAWVWSEERYLTIEELAEDLDRAVQFPGLTNSWTMPIRTRIDMLSTGIKTPVGVKLMGPDLNVLSQLGSRIEATLKTLRGSSSVYAERVSGGNYLDFDIRRDQLARYGLTVAEVQSVVMTAVGGMNVTHTVEGLARYPVNLRYHRDFRDDVEKLRRVLVPGPGGVQVPLAALCDFSFKKGPPAIKSENARPTAWVYADIKGVDLSSYVKKAKALVEKEVPLPVGYSIVWSGQYEYMEKSQKTLSVIIPVTLLIIFALLYLHFGNFTEAGLVMVSLPFALVGGVWLVWLLGYNLSVAVAVGFIALAGLAAETGVVMLVYLDAAFRRRLSQNLMNSPEDLRAAVIEGAVERVRPKFMTAATTLIGLLPVMIGSEAGSRVMKRIAAPMVGGLISSVFLTLIIIPALYYIWKSKAVASKK